MHSILYYNQVSGFKFQVSSFKFQSLLAYKHCLSPWTLGGNTKRATYKQRYS